MTDRPTSTNDEERRKSEDVISEEWSEEERKKIEREQEIARPADKCDKCEQNGTNK